MINKVNIEEDIDVTKMAKRSLKKKKRMAKRGMKAKKIMLRRTIKTPKSKEKY